MRITWSPTSFRLIGGFAVILGIFAAAAMLSMRNLERMVHAVDELRRAQDGLSAVLQMQSLALRQDAAVADLVVEGNYERIEHFYSVAAQMERARQRVGVVLTTSEEKRWLQECRAVQDKLNSTFRIDFVPSLTKDDAGVEVEQFRRQCHRHMERIMNTCGRMRLRLRENIYQGTSRALAVQEAAVRNSGILFAVAVLASVVVSMWVARSVVTPIQKLIDGTEAIGRGDLSRRIELRRSDEFGRLAESFNRMTDTLRDHQRQLGQAEKMASLGQLAAGVAHEINNPLGVILGYTRVLLRDESVPEREREELQTIEEEALQCERIVQELLDLSRPMPAASDPVELNEIIAEVLDRARSQAGDGRLAITHRHRESALPVTGDRSKLRQAVQNIVQNAVEAMPEGGRFVVEGRRQRGPWKAEGHAAGEATRDFVTVEFQDTGCGIAAEDLGSLFDPFFSRKSAGTGLGLSITYNIIRAHGGHIDVRSRLGKGSSFVVSLPARASAK